MKKLIIVGTMILGTVSGFAQIYKVPQEVSKTGAQIGEISQKTGKEIYTALDNMVGNLSQAVRNAQQTLQINQLKLPMGEMSYQKYENLLNSFQKTNNQQIQVLHDVQARLLPAEELHHIIFPQSDQMYVPAQLAAQESQSVFRGIKIPNLKALKNMLNQGMEVSKSTYSGQVFTTPSLRIALNYALPSKYDIFAQQRGEVNIPVLIRINLTEELLATVPSGKIGLQQVFYGSIPSENVTDIMVFMEVNGKQAWHKAILKDGEVFFLAVPNQAVSVNDDFFVTPGQTFQTDIQNNVQVFASFTANEKAVSSAAADFSVLPDEQLRAAISNDDEMRLFVPESFVQEDKMLYRGLRLKNTAELQNILQRGMEIDKTHHEMIYVSPNVSVAMGYMFPSQTARLLGTHEGEEALPVLVKIPVTERLLQENPPLKPEGEFGGRRVLYENVPADMITDVAVYAQINGVQGWYRVTLKNDKLVFMPIPTKAMSGWISL